MTDHKFTDEEVIKALGCCVEGMSEACRKCVFGLNPPYPVCKTMVEKHALDLINRQKAEIATKNAEINAYSIAKKFDAEYFNADIKKLEKENAELRVENHILATEYAERVRAEAIKEFAERAKRRLPVISPSVFDNIAKEMTEGK